MSELESERVSPKIKDKVDEIEKSCKALLHAFKELEKETGEVYMPIGEYLGYKFEE